MRELYIQGKGKMDCERILGMLLGLGAEPEKIQENLEIRFSFPVKIEVTKVSGKEYSARIITEAREKIGLDRAEKYFAGQREKKGIDSKVSEMAVMLWQASNMPAGTPFLKLAGEETSLVSLSALAEAMELLEFSQCRVWELEEGLGAGEGGLVPSNEIMRILEKSSLPVNFSCQKEENLTPGSAAFLAVYGKPAGETGRKEIRDWACGVSWEKENSGIIRGVILEEKQDIPADEREKDRVQVLETNVDDCSGEQLGYAIDRLMKAGALDASCFPIFMKKGRPAYMLQVICKKEKQEELEDIIFRETTSIGLRRYEENRRILPRSFEEITLRDGHKVKIKICCHHGEKFFYPEYDTVRQVCEETGRPYRSVYDEAAALAGDYSNDI